MLWWRKRDEGFEWQNYVRTTIKLRRDARRDKAERLKQQAAEGVRAAGAAAGAAAVDGARQLGAGSRVALSGSARMTSVALSGLGRVLRVVGERLSLGAGWVLRHLRDAAVPVAALVARQRLGFWLYGIGSFVLGVGLLRAVLQRGFDPGSGSAVLLGLAVLAVAATPMLARGAPPNPISARLATLSPKLRLAALASGGAVVLGLAVFAMAGVLGRTPSVGGVGILTGSLQATRSVAGRAVVLGPGLLQVGSTPVRLSGIEVPERDQVCTRPGNRRWRCGDASTAALQRLLTRPLRCDLDGTDTAGRAAGVCFAGDADINAALVKGGHAFAISGLFSRYGGLEGEAKAAKVGLWSGEAQRPGEWRSKRWEEASRRAPNGCPVKAPAAGAARVYLLPWSAGYDRARIDTQRGGRWFCTEAEAQAAGWKPPISG